LQRLDQAKRSKLGHEKFQCESSERDHISDSDWRPD
jgi:hypothetical protein